MREDDVEQHSLERRTGRCLATAAVLLALSGLAANAARVSRADGDWVACNRRKAKRVRQSMRRGAAIKGDDDERPHSLPQLSARGRARLMGGLYHRQAPQKQPPLTLLKLICVRQARIVNGCCGTRRDAGAAADPAGRRQRGPAAGQV